MMPKRISPASVIAAPVRIVIVTMDTHLSGAVMRAVETVRAEIPSLEVALHGADEWGSDPAALAACRADIARGDIIFAGMLFLDDHIRLVLPALTERRAHCDAMICALSAGEVVKLTRAGRLDMSAEAKGAMALLKRMRGQAGKGGSSGKGQMKMLRQLPKLLRFIPGTAQDLRAYFLTLQYWLAGSEENVANLLRMLVERYAAGPRRLRNIRKSGCTTRTCRAGSSTTSTGFPATVLPAPSVCWCCAPISWPATQATTTA
jgi:magnesium chelatase subunit H